MICQKWMGEIPGSPDAREEAKQSDLCLRKASHPFLDPRRQIHDHAEASPAGHLRALGTTAGLGDSHDLARVLSLGPCHGLYPRSLLHEQESHRVHGQQERTRKTHHPENRLWVHGEAVDQMEVVQGRPVLDKKSLTSHTWLMGVDRTVEESGL